MSDANAISVRGLRKSYGSVRAVDGLDLDIARGEVFALLGPNGAGKTTTVRSRPGIQAPGRWHRDGSRYRPARADGRWRARIGMVLQLTSEPELTVAEWSGSSPSTTRAREIPPR